MDQEERKITQLQVRNDHMDSKIPNIYWKSFQASLETEAAELKAGITLRI